NPIGESIGLGLGRRQPHRDVDRNGLQSQLSCRLVVRMADDDDALFIEHERLIEAERLDRVATAFTAASLRRGLFSYGRMLAMARTSTSMAVEPHDGAGSRADRASQRKKATRGCGPAWPSSLAGVAGGDIGRRRRPDQFQGIISTRWAKRKRLSLWLGII